MPLSETETAGLMQLVKPWMGQRVRDASRGVGSYLTLDFGRTIEVPVTDRQTLQRGEWHLWVQYCAWRIEARGQVLAGSDDPPRRIARAVKYFEGMVIEAVQIAPPGPDVVFAFERGMRLKLFPVNFTGQYESWSLYMPDQSVLTFGGKQQWRVDAPSHKLS